MSTRLLNRVEAAEFLNGLGGIQTTAKGLAKRAHTGTGPKFHRFGPRVLYAPADLEEWFRAYLSAPRSSTSDTGEG